MAIISANRYSKMNGNFIIAANESYGINDIGRILAENEANDMAIFNASLKHDMYELKCRTEGTLLESELQSLSENALQDFFKSIIEKLKKFWAKAKGVFKKAYAMVTAYVVRNGKAFLAANKKLLSEIDDSIELKGECWCPKKEFNVEFNKFSVDDCKRFGKDMSASEIAKDILTTTYKGYDADESLVEYLKKEYFEKKNKPTLRECGGKASLMSMLENGMKPVKELKKAEKEAEKAIKKSIKELETEARNAAKASDDQKVKDEKTKEANFYKAASTGMTNAMSTEMKAIIKITRFMLAQARINLAKAIGVKAHVESTLMESEILQIVEEAELEDGEDVTPEIEEIAEKLVELVKEEIEDDDDGEEDDD